MHLSQMTCNPCTVREEKGLRYGLGANSTITFIAKGAFDLVVSRVMLDDSVHFA